METEVTVTIPTHGIEMDRALVNRFRTDLSYEHIYFDLDDTIIFNAKTNPFIMAFIYQCINNGKKVHLLTKTESDLPALLKKYRLEGIFDSVTVIAKSDRKHRYIREFPCIFIDDSFSERLEVLEKLQVPAFDTCSVESLLDWRS